jgi:SAM-dependent methyltransferase
MDAQANFWEQARAAFDSGQLVKLTLSKPRRKGDEPPRQVYARRIELRGSPHWTCVLRYERRDETRNFAPAEGIEQLADWLGTDFANADLFTLDAHLSLQLSRKGKARLREHAARHDSPPPPTHDRPKQRLITAEKPYLTELGITNAAGKVRSAGRRKFRQINKYVEIIDSLLRDRELPAGARIVDMGSGKGYLTFALYDHLHNELGLDVQVTGVELRPQLVADSNALAQRMGFTGLRFAAGTIADFPLERVDVLIALHACDTATDDALLRGIEAGAELLIVAPCCQKQVRRDMEPPATVTPLLRHGILLERQAEMLTDGLRALYLEALGYRTKVFEFINTEHTPKNLMITASRGEAAPAARQQIATLKETFGVGRHYLEEQLVSKALW